MMVEGTYLGSKHSLLLDLGSKPKFPYRSELGSKPYTGAKLAKSLIFRNKLEFATHSSSRL